MPSRVAGAKCRIPQIESQAPLLLFRTVTLPARLLQNRSNVTRKIDPIRLGRRRRARKRSEQTNQ
jgi:hypothetical protein